MGVILNINRLVYILIIFSIILFTMFNIYFNISLNKESLYKPNSNFSDWNNNNIVQIKKINFNQYNTIFSGLTRELVHVPNSWNNDSIFTVNNEIVSYYDNKNNGFFNDSEISFLKNHDGSILYIIESKPFQTVSINNILVQSKFIIKDNNNSILGYVESNNFDPNNFDIKSIDGIKLINIRKKVFNKNDIVFEYTKTNNNIFPLSLAFGISSRVHFYKQVYDLYNIIYKISYIIMLVSLIVILYCIIKIMFILIKRGKFN